VTYNQVNEEGKVVHIDSRMSTSMGYDQESIHQNADIDFTQLKGRIPCAHICFFIGDKGKVGTIFNR
jgi:hypothetical protein